ncbi:MAG: HAMP domain-containing protein [Candidatus Omnitrophica bacterium]|nr:HAMP domain-containing protein [Candidatus Omnitrophota bacterium]
MRIKFWHALSFRGKVIVAIITLQVAMIAIFVSVQTYHEFLVVRQHIKDTNVHFAENLAHAFSVLVQIGNLSLLQQCVDIATTQHDVRYVLVQSSGGGLLASRFKDSAAVGITREGEIKGLSTVTQVRETREGSSWLALLSPTAYEISVPVRVSGREVGVIRVGISTQRMDQKVWVGALRGLLMAGFALGLVGILAFFVDRRLKGIFRGLIGVTRRMAAGDLTQRVNIDTGDELEELGQTFNRMADSLASSQELLQRWARDLEVKVKERTQDLEEEKQKLDGIVSGIGAGLVLLSKDLKVLWGNRIVTEWFGPLDHLQGKKCYSALWAEDNFCQDCASMRAIRSGNVEHSEKVVAGGNSQARVFQITTSPIKNSQGAVIQIVELIQDITEKKQLEAQLLQAGKMVAMGELASGVAHEINNPLAVIGAHAERMSYLFSNSHLAPDKVKEKFPSYLEAIIRHTYRCKEIIEKLLSFARHKEVDLQPMDINMALEDSIALVSHRASMENKRVIKNLNPALPLVQSDTNGLEQVFVNILTNAMDAIEGKGEIRVSSRLEDGLIKVEIADTGNGILPENMDRIFQPFFTTKPPGKGTGLGLSICARILSRLNGQITVQSNPGEGARFCVALPIEAGEQQGFGRVIYGETHQNPVSGR